MYAIIQTGGKQVKAEPGKTVKVEKISGDVGQEVRFDQVLLVADGEEVRVGRPYVTDVPVIGRIVEHGRHRKIVVFKYKRRKDYKKTRGHRQHYTAVHIERVGEPVGEVVAEGTPEAEGQGEA